MNPSLPLLPPAPLRRPAARLAALSAALCAALCATPAARASGAEPYIGELMLFGGNYCPLNWLPADGRTMNIADHDLLFALLGTTYGGDGQTTFHLPDLRGRTAVGTGTGPGLPTKSLGQSGGVEHTTLTANHLPAHIHSLPASTQPATHATPAPGRVPAAAQNGGAYASAGPAAHLQATGASGGQQAFSVRSPYLAMQWCIAINGLYPSQN